MQQADQAIAAGRVLQDLHRDHLVVGADVRVLEDRGDLELVGSNLVVTGLDRDAQLGQLQLDLQHVGQHPLWDRAEVVVIELMTLRRFGAEQGAAGRQQIGAFEVVLLVDQEVLLLAAGGGEHVLGLGQPQQLERADGGARSASIERSSGILLSSASPVQEVKAVGMHRRVPFGFSSTKAGEVGSQAV